ncbi:MAG: hypothetical protein JW741_18395 [Sedimentisphaerales bacterium]|nr:hypothetical protein [Sedimentisphaerales bacterium]
MDAVKQPKHVDIEHLPDSGTALFGRVDDLRFLNEIWDAGETHIACLVAPGGVGKSALVLHWLEKMKEGGYRGADYVYGWSFYSQGVNDWRSISAEAFINKALREWVKNTELANSSRSFWEKGECFGEWLQQTRTLLVLDGLEPLQSPLANDRGKVTDLAIASLFRQLIGRNPGLCVVTTREPVRDLRGYGPQVKHRDLDQISARTGREILRHHNVKGKDEDLERLSCDFGNHALTVTLLGAYLFSTMGRHVKNASRISGFAVPEAREDIDRAEQRARQVIAALTEQFGENRYRNVLQLLGLFDRPVTAADLNTLRVENRIEGLTDDIHELSSSEWDLVLDHLRRARLLLPKSHVNQGGIDAHPIVRAHFRAELEGKPEIWRKANSILYEYYSSLPEKHRPESLEDMEPLYRAIDHGCNAAKYQETLDGVLIDRLRRGDEHYSFFKGFLGQEMTALSRFFKHPWGELADEESLSPLSQAWLLNEAGSVLRVTGNLSQAVAPIRRSIELLEENREFMRASRSAATLVNVYRLMGKLDEALAWAERAVDFVNRSDSTREKIAKYSLLASVYYIRGETTKAKQWIDEAGKLQGNATGDDKLMSGHYEVLRCSLLAGQGKWEDIQRIMEDVLEWLPEANTRSQGLALSTLGRALFELAACKHPEASEAEEKLYANAEEQLYASVDKIRETGRQDELPRVLLCRAECLLRVRKFEVARRDIDEAYEISTRLGMRLHEVNARVAYARLYLLGSPRDVEAALIHLEAAKEIAADAGYLLRSEEMTELLHLCQSNGTGPVAPAESKGAGGQVTEGAPVEERSMFKKADVGILTVIPNEGGPVVARLKRFPSYRRSHEGRIYHGVEVPTESGAAHTVVMTNASDQGQAQLTPACFHLMERFDPEVIILVGVGGSIHESIRLCDVCIADLVISYTKVKEHPDGIVRRGRSYSMRPWLSALVREFFITRKSQPPSLHRGNKRFLLHLCPIGTGNAVIGNPLSEVRKWLQTVNDKTGVVDTESEGLFEVAAQSELSAKNRGLRGVMVVRGISDHADEEKGDNLQAIATANAMEAVISFLQFCPSFVPSR